MDARFYNSDDIDVERLALDLVNAYLAQGYKAQQIGDQNQVLVQLKKGGDFEAILGMQAALSLSIQRTSGGVLAMIGQQRWIDKAAVGAIGIVALPVLWPLAVTAGVGALRQASLANQVLNMVDGLVRQQRPGLVGGPIPSNLLPQMQQQWAPLPAPSTPTYMPQQPVLSEPMYAPPSPGRIVNALPSPVSSQTRCPNCNTAYEPGDTFCTGCGRPLAAAKVYCTNCNNELKSGASFCPRCGATTFSAVSNAQPAPRPAPTPVQPTITYVPPTPQPPAYTPPPQPVQATPVYTPPPQPVKPETPVYTPPPVPPKPVTPAYTPPTPTRPESPPTPQVYYVPSQSTPSEGNQPTVPATPSSPTEPYYVPPVTQEPPIKPQPKVTIVPGTPKQEPPPPQKPRPQKQYYIPSNQVQPTVPANQSAPYDTASSSQVQATRPAQPEAEASPAPTDAPWGLLVFNDEQQVQLKGERALVGRYDHDMGGMQPEVDLGEMPGADTVSRIHAAIEYIGSSYTLTDLNSTNLTRINGKRLEPDKPTAINDGDTLQFGKITSTFKKA